jgi:hypothetical protein
LKENVFSQSDYVPHAFGAEIGRNPSVNVPGFDNDCNAAYQCSLMAAITGEERYAEIAKTIVMGWSNSLERVSGADAVLMAGLGPFKLINAAEILRAIGSLDGAASTACDDMLRRAILPAIMLFDRALQYYLHGDGDGRLTHYIYENGQCQESGRDQQHTQLGLAHMGDACQIAWNQGLDLYGAVENRLLLGFEYTASFNMGDEVDFHSDIDRTGKYRHEKISPRSGFRPIYEQIYAHYHGRLGLPAPAVERVVNKIRPEGAAQGADHTGFGTLLYAIDSADLEQKTRVVAPAALHVHAASEGIDVSWLAPRGTHDLVVERAGSNGVFRAIASSTGSGTGVPSIRNTSVKRGELYKYRVASRAVGMRPFYSPTAEVMKGLPDGWQEAVLGNPSIAGNSQFNGEILTVNACGAGLMEPSDEGRFVAVKEGCAAIEVRFLPQTASQTVMFGLACRSGFSSIAPCAALLISPQAGDRERHGWHVRLMVRNSQGEVNTISETSLSAPTVTYGRLVRPVWLRLQRHEKDLRAQFSTADSAAEWRDAGLVPDIEHGLMGMVASSGIPEVDCAVRFDSLSLH